MADTRSFFERLTGSVRIQDADDGKGAYSEPADLFAETVAERPAERRVASGRKKRLSDDGDIAAVPQGQEILPSVVSRKEPLPVEEAAPSQDVDEPEGQLTVDIYDDGDSIVIQSTVAGVSEEDLDLSVTSDMVTLKGRRRRPQIKEENYYYKELYWGSFSRSVILPEEVEADEAEAELKKGLLTVRLPKKSKHVLKKIKVKAD